MLKPFNHNEAFCHMLYASADNKFVLRIWNSRDGVAPFIIFFPNGDELIELKHVLWQADLRDVMYVPWVGERIFANLTLDAARESRRTGAAKLTEEYKAQCVAQLGVADFDAAIETLAQADYGAGDRPDMILVDEGLRQFFLEQRNAAVGQLLSATERKIVKATSADLQALNGRLQS